MDNKVDLSFAIGLPPEKVIAYFQSKGYDIGFHWQEVWQESHARAFTVAGILKQDILHDIKQSLDNALAQGQPFHQWKKDITPLLEQKGWLGKTAELIGDENGELQGKRLTPYRLQTIYRTNMKAARMAAHYQVMRENAENRPFWQYSAILDERTRPAHRDLDGKVYRYDDPFWDYFYPPNGWNCRCTVIPLNQRDMDKQALILDETRDADFVDIEQVVGTQTRQAKAYKLGAGRVFKSDVGFNYNVGKAYLANLGQTLLEKGVTAPPLTASIAINETFKQAKLISSVTESFKQEVSKISEFLSEGIARPQGRLWHIGALLPEVVSALEQVNIPLSSAVLSIDDHVIYHMLRDNKAKRQHQGRTVDKRLPVEFIQGLPRYLLSPVAVVQDLHQQDNSLLYVFNSPTGKVVIKLNYDLKSKGEVIRTNMIRSGEIVLDLTTFNSNMYKLLWGHL